MSCPTCSHTMHAMGCKVTDKNFYWCPRCGTMLVCEGGEAVAPALVHRCREFENTASIRITGLWTRLGIAEAIRVDSSPEEG